MLGFLIGTACLIGLFAVVAGGRRRGYRGRFRRGGLHGVLRRLDTGPGQEKVIREALDQLYERARGPGRTLHDTRRDLADAVRGDRVDEGRVEEVFARHDGALRELRSAAVEAMRVVHETLDPRQRKLFAQMFERGLPWAFHGC